MDLELVSLCFWKYTYIFKTLDYRRRLSSRLHFAFYISGRYRRDANQILQIPS